MSIGESQRYYTQGQTYTTGGFTCTHFIVVVEAWSLARVGVLAGFLFHTFSCSFFPTKGVAQIAPFTPAPKVVCRADMKQSCKNPPTVAEPSAQGLLSHTPNTTQPFVPNPKFAASWARLPPACSKGERFDVCACHTRRLTRIYNPLLSTRSTVQCKILILCWFNNFTPPLPSSHRRQQQTKAR